MSPRISIAAVVMVAGVISGCCKIGHRVGLRIVDGHTGSPIAGAKATVNYGEPPWLQAALIQPFRPCNANAQSGTDGVAWIKLTGDGPEWHILAEEFERYMARPNGEIPGDFFPTVIDGSKGFLVPLYREPPPQITIVLPDSYKGAVRVTRNLSGQWLEEPGANRPAEFRASAQGDVEITTSPLLHRVGSYLGQRDKKPGFLFRYANGAEIPYASARWFRIAAPLTSQPAFGVDCIAEDGAESNAPVKRALFVVGGKEEMTAMVEAFLIQRSNYSYFSFGGEQFNVIWNRR